MEKAIVLNNFLEKFKVNEIDNVISDWKLIKEFNYTIYNVVDTFDINNFFLPYLQRNFFNSKDKSSLAQNTIAYNTAFKTETNHKEIILIDEYKFELLSIKNDVKKRIEKFNSISSDLSYFFNDITSILDESKRTKTIDTLNKNFDIILSYLVLLKSKDDIYGEFISFLNTKFLTSKFDTGNYFLDNELDEIFELNSISDLSKEIYKEFIDRRIGEIATIQDEKRRYLYLENTYRDIAVIERLLRINKQLLETKNTSKIFIYYLSSAPYKTNRLFALPSVSNNLPIIHQIGDQGFNFHRNIFQVFLLKIILNSNLNDDDAQSILYALKNFVKDINISKRINNHNNRYAKIFEDILISYSSNIENELYFEIYENEKKRLKKAINNINEEKDINMAKEIINYIDNNIKKSKAAIEKIPFEVEKYRQTFFLAQKFESIKNNIEKFRINAGKDIIRNPFHMLPYLPFFYRENVPDVLYELFNKISEAAIEEDINKNILIKNIELIVEKITPHRINIEFDYLTISYLCLITTSYDNLWSANISEKELIDNLEMHKLHISSFYPEFKTIDNKSAFVLKDVSESVREFDYLLAWLYRRNNYLEKAISLCENYCHKELKDPRFFHGLSLSYLGNLYYNYSANDFDLLDKQEEINSLIITIISTLQKAYEGYENIVNNKNNLKSILIIKNKIAILNSLADIIIRKYILNKEQFDHQYLIEQARKHIETIKILFKDINLIYDNFPTYNHTEAELEYFESKMLLKKSREINIESYKKKTILVSAHKKIIESQRRVSLFTNKPRSLDSFFSDLPQKINQLFIEIIIDLNYI